MLPVCCCKIFHTKKVLELASDSTAGFLLMFFSVHQPLSLENSSCQAMSIQTELEHFMEYVFGFCAALDEEPGLRVTKNNVRKMKDHF